jgi:hypothetical protein
MVEQLPTEAFMLYALNPNGAAVDRNGHSAGRAYEHVAVGGV